MEQFDEILEKLKSNPKAKDLLGKRAKPESFEAAIKVCAGIVKELSFDLTEAEIRDGIAAAEQERAEKTEKAAADIQALPDDDLVDAAGGRDRKTKHHDECVSAIGDWTELGSCRFTYIDGENCRSSDGCDQNFHYYEFYHCGQNYYGQI
ncbi:MAG: hypothetical protein IK099_10540 [Clostridia bacterium]|nr:hypothetical protein [Clostridia bacterium]